MKAVNLGSGQRKFHSQEGIAWINVDSNPRWTPDYVAHGDNMPEIEDGEIDIIVAHHVIEHVGLGEFDNTIRECHRILKPGGSFIVTTPDLRALCYAWIEQKISDYIFCVNLYGAYMNDEADRHKWLFTKQTLLNALSAPAKWSGVYGFDWRPIPGSDIARDFWIQGAECVK